MSPPPVVHDGFSPLEAEKGTRRFEGAFTIAVRRS